MSRELRDVLIDFVTALRDAGVRISVAESIDAMRAVGTAGLAMVAMREAMRATLIKDEADNPTFDRLFNDHFRRAASHIEPGPSGRGSRVVGAAGRGTGSADHPLPQRTPAAPEPDNRSVSAKARPMPQESRRAPERHVAQTESGSLEQNDQAERRPGDRETTERADAGFEQRRDHGVASATMQRQRLERLPFIDYSPLDYEQARDTLALILRRWRIRLGRRLKHARRGRLDFRRTIRASLQRGGIPLDRHFRARRPRRLGLIVLADISGSVHYASLLMLELMAGAAHDFPRMRGFVFIDQLAAADFEQGHLVITPQLDRYARSDFGRVLGELEGNFRTLLNRATVLVILGDGRNNRRPPRADLLRTVAARCRAVIWLNPEPRERWGTGDSAITTYERAVDVLLPCNNLRELQISLWSIV